jgi:uncharacterized protein YgbK (DUF1537 family)
VPDWVVVADDLTGALDAAAALAPGGGGHVLLAPGADWPEASDVVAISTRTRDGEEAATPQRVGQAVTLGLHRGASVLVKIDSLLRGEVGGAVRAGLEAQRAVTGRCVAVVAPAFPARGRITRGGRVEVGGDPRSTERDVAAALAAAGLRSLVLGRGAPLPAVESLLTGDGDRPDAVIVDCESDEDLARVAALAGRPDVLLVGTAGLAGRLPPAASRAGRAEVSLDGRAVLAIGSLAPAALGQVSAVVRAGIPHVPVAAAPAEAGRRARELLQRGHVLLTPDAGIGADPDTVAATLAAAVGEVADAADVLVLSGGHTAQAVLDRIGVTSLELVAELEPGVVASRVPGGDRLVVTKAGAFGDDTTLLRLLDRSIPSPPGRSAS